jgi:murein DD-endopeptidase MepM/ murein hydrolase activator NlpD
VTRIAARFHISPESILWANAKLQDNPDQLSIGQNLNIPPTTGVLYTVQNGDTVAGISARFKAKVQDILGDPLNATLHDLKSNPPKLAVGQFLMVPKGQKALEGKRVIAVGKAPRGAARGTSVFMWPTSGCIYQVFWRAHGALDLDNVIGTPIYAADSGYVAAAGGGWNYGYGNMVLLDHSNGYLTRYGHLNVIMVVAGQSVKKGQLIGRMGTTGNSTGPHLHFEVIRNGALVDPRYQVSGRAPARCPGR